MNKIINGIDFEQAASGINREVKINPQKINALLRILSAKYPKQGWSIEEKICEQLKIIVATGMEILICSAINGIMGFKNPV